MSALTDSPEWQALAQHQAALSERPLNTLFRDNPDRFAQFSLNTDGLLLDFSKNHIDAQAIDLFENLAQKTGLGEAIETMFSGDVINNTEQRPALHVALRSPEDQSEYGQVLYGWLDPRVRYD